MLAPMSVPHTQANLVLTGNVFFSATGAAKFLFCTPDGAGGYSCALADSCTTQPCIGQYATLPGSITLPATSHHPAAFEPFRAVPVRGARLRADLGVWNIFANPDFPKPQTTLRGVICLDEFFPDRDVVDAPALDDSRCSDAALLPKTIARFKTPGLRDLSHSGPYFHNGQFATLNEVVAFYSLIAPAARAGAVRNAALNLTGIAIDASDVDPLVAFLKSLNEDYN